MRECTLPTYQEAALCHHLDVHQSQAWSWTHHGSDAGCVSRGARLRLGWLQYYQEHDGNVRLTCRHFGISRPTFYRWRHRFEQTGLRGLEDRSHRPHRICCPTWTVSQTQALLALREQYPRWGKVKLSLLLVGEGHQLSISMVGRILHRLRQSGQLREGRVRSLGRRRWQRRPYAVRKPKDYSITGPGDLVEVDTLDIRPRNGTCFTHLSLVDVTSRFAAAELGTGATASTITRHVDQMRARLPFPIKAIQVDGGSEFKADFEAYCQQHELRLFVLPPRSPKLNGMVERLQRTFTEEFYQCTDAPLRVAALATELRAFEHTYNTIRPHQSLGYQTPAQFLAAQKESA
jgi:putative transposase